MQLESGLEPAVKDPHVPAALLKMWFRQLPMPIIPHEYYSQCLAAASFPDLCSQLINSLPHPTNRLVLATLIKFLQKLWYTFFGIFRIKLSNVFFSADEETVKITKMDVSNIGKIGDYSY